MGFKWIDTLFWFNPKLERIAVVPQGLANLKTMADDLEGTGDLLAVYVPAGADHPMVISETRGRVVGAVRLVRMPHGKTTADYADKDPATGEVRWPHGWPCEVVYCPPPNQCPLLSDLLAKLDPPKRLDELTIRFRAGPIHLNSRLAAILDDAFSAFERLR